MIIFVELIYGISIDSFDLINDAYHIFWDCGILLIFLYPMSIAEQAENRQYSFGYGGIEVLAGFINAIRLFLLALSIVYHSINQLLQPTEILNNRLWIVGIIDLFINVVGVFLLRQSHRERLISKSDKSNYVWRSNLNLRGKRKDKK